MARGGWWFGFYNQADWGNYSTQRIDNPTSFVCPVGRTNHIGADYRISFSCNGD
jgi:hypothetical protein